MDGQQGRSSPRKRQKRTHDGIDSTLKCTAYRTVNLAKGRSQRLGPHLVTTLYSPITTHEIRLLILLPKIHGLALTTELVTATVGRGPGAFIQGRSAGQGLTNYTALSYCWGCNQPQRPLVISGTTLQVGENLYEFLQQYRHETEERILWIDAVCMNQEDEAEKALHLKNMLMVYQNAQHVVVWLGKGNEYTNKAIEYMEAHSERVAFGPFVDWSMASDAVLVGGKALYNSEWLRRIWVVQEVWAARDITVWCGSSKLCWATYMGGARHSFSDKHPGYAYPSQFTTGGPTIETKCRRALEDCWELLPAQTMGNGCVNEKSSMLDRILQTTVAKSTVSHDRIRALLGMVINSLDFDVDAPRPAAVLFAKFTKHLMKIHGVFTILALDGAFGGEVEHHKLPSWSLDWTTVTPLQYFSSKSIDADMSAFLCSQTLFDLHAETDDLQPLILRGTRVAVIDAAESRPHYRVSWSTDHFEVETDVGPLAPPSSSRLLAKMSIANAKPISDTCDPTYAKLWRFWAPQEGKSTDFYAPLNAEEGDVVVAMNGSSLPLILRDVPRTDDDPVRRFTFIGMMLPTTRYHEGRSYRGGKRTLSDQFSRVRASIPNEDFIIE